VVGVVATRDLDLLRRFERDFPLPFDPVAEDDGWAQAFFGESSLYPFLAIIAGNGTVLSVVRLTADAGQLTDVASFLDLVEKWGS
jgi:hypothetical protein